ncbi:LPS export ABC transporter permease LptF [Kumtagia ephedrae]|jgi:lipopolysaccharide export system permease protein|uniref:LPS export ABC transporter permease LptF n=1 Tax=Kumtagia ephedrae TaxID=2116701 RepID=A0A2P7SEU6_9HYPH|nr:LPS export ABC transporter permease LptF [Mesorhizobium ephedrae]PSJ61032.1 LPS export ABC transporter permease LptF [Mesorhizobium ephedrae]
MKVVERYILGRTVEVFAAALFWTLAIVWTTQVLTRIDLVTDNGQSALTFFEIATLILPSIITIVVPFALVIAVAQTLSVMNTDSELVVINAAGASRGTVMKPILLLAAAASVLSFTIDNSVDPYARERGRHLVAAARADLLSLVIQEGTFRRVDDGLFVQVGERLPDGRLGGIFVADSREEGIDLVYYAKTGAVVDDDQGKQLLVMSDGVVHRKRPSGDVSIVRFSSYAFDLSAFSKASESITMYPKDRTIAYLLDPDPNDRVFQENPRSFRVELHRRLSEWLYSIVFACIALAVAGDARSHRENRINPLITAITICLFVRWLGFFVTNQAQTAAWLTPAIYLVPFGAVAVAGWFIHANRTMELPVSWTDRLVDSGGLGERLSSFWNRLRNGGAARRRA